MNVAWVLEATSVAGGHRNVFSFANHLARRGHDVVVFCVQRADTDWMRVDVPVISCGSYQRLERQLAAYEGIKIATWWKTAVPVARTGGGLYFVQDIETSYAGGNASYSAQVLATYKLGLTHFTYGRWIEQEFRRLGLGEITRVGMAVETDIYYPGRRDLPGNQVVLFHERPHFLKGPEIRNQVLAEIRNRFLTTGFSPWSPNRLAHQHLKGLSDFQLAEHMRSAFAMLVTSVHEGFCLPALEAMACGLPVVTTYADGNEEFCIHEVNCLMGRTATELVAHLDRLKADVGLWQRLRGAGIDTAARYNWETSAILLEKLLAEH